MNRSVVLGVLMAMGAVSMTVRAAQQPRRRPARRRASSRSRSSGTTCSCCAARRRRQHRRVHHRQRRRGRRHQEPRLGPAAPRQDQGAHRQAGHDDHQHAHARRPRERQRRVPGDRRSRDAREHREEHGGDAQRHRHHAGARRTGQHLQGEQRPRPAEADVQGQDDDRQGRRPDRPLLLRPRPHQRRRVGRVPGAARSMHAGDIFSGKNIPLLDANNGGSGVEIGDTLAKAANGVKNVDTIITGHSTVMTMADLREYAEFNSDFAARRAGGQEGRQDGGRGGAGVEDSGEVQGLRGASRRAAEGERADRLRRDEVAGSRVPSRRRFIATAAGAGAALAAGPAVRLAEAQQAPATPAAGPASNDLVLVNGRIHTMDARNSRGAQRSPIRNGRIAAVGDAPPPARRGTRVIDLRGRTVVPGLIEPHVHIVSLANRPGYHTILENTTLDPRDAGGAGGAPQGRARRASGSRRWAAGTRTSGPSIVIRRCKELDEAVPDRPVLLYERFTGPCVDQQPGQGVLRRRSTPRPRCIRTSSR